MLKRSGSKAISVDRQSYRYRVSEVGADKNGGVSLAITMQHDLTNGAHLRVTGLATQRLPEAESKFYSGRTVQRSVGPRHMERLIKLALARGWEPLSPGQPFLLEVENADVFESHAIE